MCGGEWAGWLAALVPFSLFLFLLLFLILFRCSLSLHTNSPSLLPSSPLPPSPIPQSRVQHDGRSAPQLLPGGRAGSGRGRAQGGGRAGCARGGYGAGW